LVRLCAALAAVSRIAFAGTGVIKVDAGKPGATISPDLYGIFFEEISHAGDGGLYAELIRNRGFEDANLPPACARQGNRIVPPRTPHFWTQPKVSDWTMEWNVESKWPGWSLQTAGGATASIGLTDIKPLSAASPHSLQVDIAHLPAHGRVTLVNEGYWGIGVRQGEEYRLSFYARSDAEFGGPLTAALKTSDGRILASHEFAVKPGDSWRKYAATLSAAGSEAHAHLALSFGSRGRLWVDFVSLFPAKTFHDRPNGMRSDIAQMIAEMKPAFLRFPGGCYVEGITVESRPQWKTTLGRLEDRVPTYSPWGYWSTNGIGYHEFLQFAEDIGASALYVVNAGISCAFRSGTFIPDEGLEPLIQDTLDAIEYAIGPPDSKWGSLRAKAGHPAPFELRYIEVGNEDQGPRYGERFARFYKAIKARYPRMNVVLGSWISGIDRGAMRAAGKFDILDEHAYRGLYWSFDNFDSFEKYKREGWDLYIGEFATNAGVGRGNLLAALGDAAYMMSMENNADLVKMGSYAPLLENVNKPDWEVNLIHFDSSRVFGRAAYYMCKLFAENRPDTVLPVQVTYLPAAESPISGRIGLGTYGTAADFRDLRVESGGRVVYQSDFSKDAGGWQTEAGDGDWAVEDGMYRQKKEAVAWSYFGDRGWKDVTVSVKARKAHGHEGFVVVLGKADNRRIEWNVGGFGNHLHAVEADDEVIGTPVHAGVETGKWYDVKLEVRGRTVRCYLDGKAIGEVTLPRVETVLAVAGRDAKAGEIVIKALNTGHEPAAVSFEIDGAEVAAEGKLIRLTSRNPEDENSFEDLRRIVPTTRTLRGLAPHFAAELPPWSLSILRLPVR
jgi:alpha-L-arabinofuranosidase